VKLEGGAKTRSPSLTFSTPGPTASTLPTPSLPMTAGSGGAECVDALCDHEVVRVDEGKLDADQELVRAGSVGLGNASERRR